jgi:hypothetical protein
MDINTLPELEIISDEEPNTKEDRAKDFQSTLDKIKPPSSMESAFNNENSNGNKGNDLMEEELLIIEEKKGETNNTPQSENLIRIAIYFLIFQYKQPKSLKEKKHLHRRGDSTSLQNQMHRRRRCWMRTSMISLTFRE